MCFVKIRDIINRIKPLSEEDKKLLNEYIEEEYGENDNLVCLTFSLPACIAGISGISPDQVRRNLNLLRPKLRKNK